ncbi:exo-alpha-sialidase [Acinetobacter baumannii]|uniref:exo-alpha-sialidase n=1 Tax=Acinetobacter baumannii TaxID=470 RepID=UPI00385C09C2
MADEIITRQQLVDASIDANSLEKFISGPDVEDVLTRLGRKYPTLAKAIRIIQETGADAVSAIGNAGGYIVTDSLSTLMTITPQYDHQVARVNETGDEYQWNSSIVPPAWKKTGRNFLTEAKNLVDVIGVINKSQNKLWNFVDLNFRPVLTIYRDGSLWIKNLSKDVATSINSSLDQLSKINGFIFTGVSSKNIFEIRDSNNSVLMKLTKSGNLYIPIFGNLTDFLNKLLATNAYFSSLISIDATSNKILAIKDNNGYVVISLYKDGRLLLPKIGDVAQVLQLIKEQTKHILAYPITSNASMGAKYVNQLIADLSTDSSSSVLKMIDVNDVIASNIFNHPIRMVRVPAITRIEKTKYLVCFEAREDGGDLTKNSVGSFIVDINPVSKTVTCTEFRSIHEAYIDQNGLTWSFMNACTVKLKSGRIICLYVKRNGTHSHFIYKRFSDDDGLTWSNYEDIGHFFDMPSFNLLCPCSQGLVKKYGENQGRIIFPVWKSGARYLLQEFRSGYIYSDDGGETWAAGIFFDVVEGNEVQCAEDINGDILFAIRGELLKPYKTFARLLDNSTKYEYLNVKEKLTEIPIMSGLIHTANEFDNSPGFFLFSQTYTNGRKDLKVWSSYDSGKSWSSYDVPETSQFSSYSSVESVTTDLKFVMWEADNYTSFKCQLVTTKDLLNKGN